MHKKKEQRTTFFRTKTWPFPAVLLTPPPLIAVFTLVAISLHIFDKGLLFSYHRLLTDDTLSSILTISELLLTSTFLCSYIVIQSLIDGTHAFMRLGKWAKRELEDDVGDQVRIAQKKSSYAHGLTFLPSQPLS
jgi:hypothetical protein